MIAADDADVDRVVEELRLDHVVVDPLRGGPEPTETHRRLVAQVQKVKAETGIDVYVALVEDVGGTDTEASNAYAARLRKELGNAPGVYVVGGADTIVRENAWGTPFSRTNISLLTTGAEYEINARWRDALGEETGGAAHFVIVEAAVRSVPGAVTWDSSKERPSSRGHGYATVLSEDDLDDLAAWGVSTSRQSDWGPQYGAESDTEDALVRNWLWAVPTFLVLLLGLGPLLRRWPARLQVTGSVPDLADVRTRAQQQLDALSAELARVAGGAAPADEDRWTRALSAQDAARTLVDSPDVAEVIGALTLALTGTRDAQIARSGSGTPWQACFFDPRHGEATGRRSWRLGQGQVELPACASCLALGKAGQVPEALLLPGRGSRVRPYYRGGSVWARTGYGSLSATYAADVLRSRA